MDPLPTREPGDAAIAGLVAQMLQTTATLTVMVDEMMRFHAAGHSAPDAPPVIDVLARLLRDVLPALLVSHPPAVVESAAAVLRDADAIMCRDLYFVLAGRDAAEPRPPSRNASIAAAPGMSVRPPVARRSGGTLASSRRPSPASRSRSTTSSHERSRASIPRRRARPP